MDSHSVEIALDRIDDALSRIEQAAKRAAAETSALSERHERLKASVSEALGELDTLLARPYE